MQIKAGFALVKLEMLLTAVFYFLKQVNQKNQVSRIIDSDFLA